MVRLWYKYIAAVVLISIYCFIVNYFHNYILELLSGIVFVSSFIYINNKIKNINHFINDENDIDELLHDLKNPVLAQIKVSEHLIKGTFGGLNETQKEIIIQLNNSARYMYDLVNNFLIVCRAKHNNININTEIFEINDIIKQCVNDLKYISYDKRCTILFDYSQELIWVKGSKTDIRRVIMNLLVNAVEYSYPNRVITANSKIENGKYVFMVNSYGNYLEKNDMQILCEKYSSLKKSGTGLGLYICKIILQKHNSTIIIKSDKKTGNNFGFELEPEEIPVCK